MICLCSLALLCAAAPHYDVRLTIDIANRVVHGKESIRFCGKRGSSESWDRPTGLTINAAHSSTGKVSVSDNSVVALVAGGHEQRAEFEYVATGTRGLHWLTKQPGLFTTFYCSGWMICSMAPAQRATLRLEIVVNGAGFEAAGPGLARKRWSDGEGRHWVFETPVPVQTYLLSFAVAQLQSTRSGVLEILAPDAGRVRALEQTESAAFFFREKTGINPIRTGYRQVYLPQSGLFGQESAQLALMTELALHNLEDENDVILMAHELAHQWWGASIGIRSWSDYWLNEGVAEYVSLLYLEHVRGHDLFLIEIERLRTRLTSLVAEGKDRPLHFEGWKSAEDALGQLPYVKGALFLDQLRSAMGDQSFWKGMARYSQRNRGKLTGSADFQKAFQESTETDLAPLFAKAVYGVAE